MCKKIVQFSIACFLLLQVWLGEPKSINAADSSIAASSGWETESNDTYEEADEIVVNVPVKGSMRTSGDNDWYKVTVPENGYVSLKFDHEYIESGKNIWKAYLYDEDRNELVNDSYAGNKKSSQGGNVGVPAGTYYVKIVKSPGRFDPWSNVDYMLTVDYASSGEWETEFNDTFEDADEINVNKTVKGSMRTSGDNDWYKVTVPENGYVSLKFDHKYIESGKNIWKAYLYDADMNELVNNSYLGNKKSSQGGNIGVLAGTYYVKIVKSPGRFDPWSNVDYMLTVDYASSGEWETEFNDTFEDADEINVNETVKGSMRTSGDNDWYKVTVPENGYVSLKFDHEYIESGKNIWKAYLYDEDRNELVNDSYAGNKKSSQGGNVGVPAGTYYVKIVKSPGRFDPWSNIDYSIKMNFMTSHPGDINQDNETTSEDALEILKIVVKLSGSTEQQDLAADVDGNGIVDATDALIVLKKVVKLIDKFPIEV